MTHETQSPASKPSRRRVWWWPVLGAALGTLLGIAVLSVFRPHVYAGVVLQSPHPAPEMEGLVYSNGETVDIAALRGEVVFVYFGYTHCPDVCPLTLATVDRALDDLGDDASRVETLMVTVDPERDTRELLGDYVANFNDEFRGVWGPEPDVRAVATQYGVSYQYEDAEDGGYLVTHTASLLTIDPDGALRIVYPFGVTADELTADLEALLD